MDISTKKYFKTHVNIDNNCNNDYIFWLDINGTMLIVCDDNLQEAYETLGNYFKDNNLKGYIYSYEELLKDSSDEEIMEEYFPVNGGEFYILIHPYTELEGRKQFNYCVTFQSWDEDDLEISETYKKGFEISPINGNIDDILNVMCDYSLNIIGFGLLQNSEPEYNKDYTEKTYYSLKSNEMDVNEMNELVELNRF